jgi:hypothetical protein
MSWLKDATITTAADKEQAVIEQERAEAQQYLTSTDWYVIRANEPDGKPIPDDILSARVAARLIS